MKVFQTNLFYKSFKKLHKNQKKILDKAIQKITKNPALGSIKKGDLAEVQVYKFKMLSQLILLAYTYNAKNKTLVLLAFGTHENFYRDLKKVK
ncbi:MAG: type II toxin-antitoxin system RelE/ParE family toxin [Oligoflexia bacterium]|nr:type II toxin-antitoxin system RelE/ParE family toxin [Oligoflexia bacterium]